MNFHPPCVSIGLAVYNGELFIEDAIVSILNQTFQDFELIISDNASSDRTEEICRTYAAKDSRIRYIRNAENLGAALNYNQTFAEARGRYFRWAAHDDLLAPTYLERCVEVLENQPDIVLCHSKTTLIDAKGQKLYFDETEDCFFDQFDHRFRKPDRPRDFSSSPHKRYQEVLIATRWCFEVFGLVRTEAFAKTSKLGAFYGADKVLLAELSLMGKFVILPDPLFLNRRHQQQSGSLKSAQEREQWINPTIKRRSVLRPRLMCLKGYLFAIFKSPLSPIEQLGCLIVLMRWLVKLDNWQRLVREGLRENLGLEITARSTSPQKPQF
ncbi:glycosyltransferase family 2 protein [Phormidesmis sp. 146-33]